MMRASPKTWPRPTPPASAERRALRLLPSRALGAVLHPLTRAASVLGEPAGARARCRLVSVCLLLVRMNALCRASPQVPPPPPPPTQGAAVASPLAR